MEGKEGGKERKEGKFLPFFPFFPSSLLSFPSFLSRVTHHADKGKKMTQKQFYLMSSIAGLILLILVTMSSYYYVKFHRTERELFEEQANRIACQAESEKLQRELTRIKAQLEAKENKVKILESTIDEIQRRTSHP